MLIYSCSRNQNNYFTIAAVASVALSGIFLSVSAYLMYAHVTVAYAGFGVAGVFFMGGLVCFAIGCCKNTSTLKTQNDQKPVSLPSIPSAPNSPTRTDIPLHEAPNLYEDPSYFLSCVPTYSPSQLEMCKKRLLNEGEPGSYFFYNNGYVSAVDYKVDSNSLKTVYFLPLESSVPTTLEGLFALKEPFSFEQEPSIDLKRMHDSLCAYRYAFLAAHLSDHTQDQLKWQDSAWLDAPFDLFGLASWVFNHPDNVKKEEYLIKLTPLFSKIFGHLFNMRGEGFDAKGETRLEGFYNGIAAAFIGQAALAYSEHLAFTEVEKEIFSEAFVKFPYFSGHGHLINPDFTHADPQKNRKRMAQEAHQSLLEDKIVTMGIDLPRHASNVTLDRKRILYTNRGDRSVAESGVWIFESAEDFSEEFLTELMTTQWQSDQQLREFLAKHTQGCRLLQVKPDQIVGNCAYANNKLAIWSVSYLLLSRRMDEESAKRGAKEIYSESLLNLKYSLLQLWIDLQPCIKNSALLSQRRHFKLFAQANARFAKLALKQKKSRWAQGILEKIKESLDVFYTKCPYDFSDCFPKTVSLSNPHHFLLKYPEGAFVLTRPTRSEIMLNSDLSEDTLILRIRRGKQEVLDFPIREEEAGRYCIKIVRRGQLYYSYIDFQTFSEMIFKIKNEMPELTLQWALSGEFA